MIEITRADRHPKGWGEETWIINTDRYCGKLLNFHPGARFSDHYHLVKDETWYVLRGRLQLSYYDLANADRLSRELMPGDVVHIPPGAPHQLLAIEESVIIEVSTPHDEADSYRIGKGDSQRNT
jgi:quercetin dioxygenase-like cupin family protein